MACDPEGERLVAVGADKRVENVGWTRTVVYDLAAQQWDTLPLPNEQTVKEHKALVTLIEGTIDLVGRIRLAWYRDPKGVGTDVELKALAEQCDRLAKRAGMAAFQSDLDRVAEALNAQNTLEALKSARAMQRKTEERAFEQYPVPPSRRNAPLVFDEKNRVFVLFGGDHEDYQMNDTWILDLEKKSWRRAHPELAPSPRAGHAMGYLPKSGRVAVYEGYAASSDPSYGASPAATLNPRELGLDDCAKNRYVLLDGGAVAYGHSAGWMYDLQRRCAYVVTYRGECWAMRIDPAILLLLARTPEPDPTPQSTP
jgi:hypothetical protein